RRFKVISLLFYAHSSLCQFGAFVDGVLDLVFQHTALHIPRKRTDVNAGLCWCSDLPRLYLVQKRHYISIEYFFMHIDALHSTATLAVVIKRAFSGGRCHRLDVGYVVAYV